jgi:hypothetical protein
MSAFIKLNKQDAFVTSYVAHKSWAVSSASFAEYGIDILIAETGSSLFNPGASNTTGIDQYQELVYSSIQHLYYSGIHTGAVATSSYEDYSQTTLHPSSSRDLGNKALLVTIPQSIFGNAVKPGTFAIGSDAPIQNYVSGAYINTGYFVTSSRITYNVFDNGEGVLLESGSLQKVGDIIYTHGLAIITNSASIASLEYLLSSTSGGSNCVGSTYIASSYIPGGYFLETLPGCSPQGFTVYWQSTKDIYTHNYRCKVRESDLNFSQNPSTHSGSTFIEVSGSRFFQHSGVPYDFTTGSYFQPYVTTVGLYNDSNELIGVGKLGQPVPKSKYTDMTFVVKFDI